MVALRGHQVWLPDAVCRRQGGGCSLVARRSALSWGLRAGFRVTRLGWGAPAVRLPCPRRRGARAEGGGCPAPGRARWRGSALQSWRAPTPGAAEVRALCGLPSEVAHSRRRPRGFRCGGASGGLGSGAGGEVQRCPLRGKAGQERVPRGSARWFRE